MRASQLAVAALLAIVALSAFVELAAAQGSAAKDKYGGGDSYKGGKDSYGGGKDDHDHGHGKVHGHWQKYTPGEHKPPKHSPHPPPSPPICPNNVLPCVDGFKGALVINTTKCLNTTKQWCSSFTFKNKAACCCYPYRTGECDKARGPCENSGVCTGFTPNCPGKSIKPPGTLCRPTYHDKFGSCDIPDFCNGTWWECPDKVKPKGTICRESDDPCEEDGECDGKRNFCPGKKWVKNGTPCSEEEGHHGLFTKVQTSGGKLATAASVSEKEAKSKGYHKCQSCYEGECVSYKVWWEKKESKHKGYGGDGKYGGKYGKDGKEGEKYDDKERAARKADGKDDDGWDFDAYGEYFWCKGDHDEKSKTGGKKN